MDVMGDNRAFVAVTGVAPPSNPFSLLVASSADVAGEVTPRLLSARRLGFSNGGDELVMASTGTLFDPTHAYSMSIAAVIGGGLIAFDFSDSGATSGGGGIGGPRSLGCARGSPFTTVSLDDSNLTAASYNIGTWDSGTGLGTVGNTITTYSPAIPTFVCISHNDNAICILFGDDNVAVDTPNGSFTFQGSGLLPTGSSGIFTLPSGYQGVSAAFMPDASQLFVNAVETGTNDTRLLVYTVDDITLLVSTWTLQSDDLASAGSGDATMQDLQVSNDGLWAIVGCAGMTASGAYGLGGVVVMTRANTGAAFSPIATIRPEAAVSGTVGKFGVAIGMSDDGDTLAAIGEPGASAGVGKAWGVPNLQSIAGTKKVTDVGFELPHSHGAGAAYGISVAVRQDGIAVAVHTSDIANKVDVWV